MKSEATGKIIAELQTSTGITKSGKDWERKEYVLEESNQHHTKVRFSMSSFDGAIINPPKIGKR